MIIFFIFRLKLQLVKKKTHPDVYKVLKTNILCHKIIQFCTLFVCAGQFLSELERHDEAAQHYLRAAELAPEDYEIVFNAANALRQSGQNAEAEMFYRHAVTLRPQVGEKNKCACALFLDPIRNQTFPIKK
jgi:tetratricopeptide (TPR) repeat protein